MPGQGLRRPIWGDAIGKMGSPTAMSHCGMSTEVPRLKAAKSREVQREGWNATVFVADEGTDVRFYFALLPNALTSATSLVAL